MNQSTMRKIILAIQTLFVILCAASIYWYVNKEVEPKQAYVYNKDLDANTVITKDDINAIKVPAKAITKKFATNEKDVVNKYLKVDVVADSFVYESQLAEKDGVDRFKSIDLSRLRLMTIPINYDQSVAGTLKKGDKVDLLFVGSGTYKDVSDSERKFSYSKVFLQNIDVYGLNDDAGKPYTAPVVEDYDKEGEDVDTGYTGELSMITLAVTVEQAEEIEARLAVGELRVLGRFSDSKSYPNTGYVIGEFDKYYTGQVNGETDSSRIVEDDAYDK